jgi:spoIIIJ-associated protein
MTPYERRIIHIALREDKRIETISEGAEPGRQIIIKVK